MKEEILEPIDIAIKKAALRYANGEWSTKQNGKRLIHSEYYPIAKTGFEEGANWVINTMLDKEKVIETLKSMSIEDQIDGGLIIVCYDLEDTANNIIEHLKENL